MTCRRADHPTPHRDVRPQRCLPDLGRCGPQHRRGGHGDDAQLRGAEERAGPAAGLQPDVEGGLRHSRQRLHPSQRRRVLGQRPGGVQLLHQGHGRRPSRASAVAGESGRVVELRGDSRVSESFTLTPDSSQSLYKLFFLPTRASAVSGKPGCVRGIERW